MMKLKLSTVLLSSLVILLSLAGHQVHGRDTGGGGGGGLNKDVIQEVDNQVGEGGGRTGSLRKLNPLKVIGGLGSTSFESFENTEEEGDDHKLWEEEELNDGEETGEETVDAIVGEGYAERNLNNLNYYVFQTAHGRYLRALDGGRSFYLDQQTYVASWEKFILLRLSNRKYAIKTAHGRYLSAQDGRGGFKVGQQTFVGPWEQFTFHRYSNGKYAIKTAHGRYLRALDGGGSFKVDQQTYVGSWEQFTLWYA